MVQIRPPVASELEILRKMLREAQLDPTSGVHLEYALVAEADGQIVGMGQIKHLRGCQELGSLVVLPAYRHQGIAGQLIRALEAQAERPLYLICQNSMGSFYTRFGYTRISYGQAPTALKLKLTLAFMARLFGIRIIAMRQDS